MDFLLHKEVNKNEELAGFLAVATTKKPTLDGFDRVLLKLFHSCLYSNGVGLDIKYDKLKDYIKHYDLELIETSEMIDSILIGYKKDK